MTGSILDAGRATCSTSPRVRGEVDLRAEPLRSEANRVRGPFHSLRLAATPPHPDSFAPLRFAWNPTSPRPRGEGAQAACAQPNPPARSPRMRGAGGQGAHAHAKRTAGTAPSP